MLQALAEVSEVVAARVRVAVEGAAGRHSLRAEGCALAVVIQARKEHEARDAREEAVQRQQDGDVEHLRRGHRDVAAELAHVAQALEQQQRAQRARKIGDANAEVLADDHRREVDDEQEPRGELDAQPTAREKSAAAAEEVPRGRRRADGGYAAIAINTKKKEKKKLKNIRL